MSEWRKVTFGDIVAMSNGTNFTKDSFGTGLKILGVRDFGDRTVPNWSALDEVKATAVSSERQLLAEGDLVFVRSNGNPALVGRSMLITAGPKATHSAFTIKARPDRDLVEPRFLAYQMRNAHRVGAMRAANGTNITNLSQPILASVPVLIPPRATQKQVLGVLGSIDELIENNRRRVEVLEEMARAIYREWFVKFRYPGYEDVPLVDSALGPIPEGWEAGTVGDVLELKYGKALKADMRRGGAVAVVSSAGIVGWHDEAVADGPSIVVGRKGNVGSVHWVDVACWPIDTAYYVDTNLPLRFVAEQLRRTEFTNTHAAVPGLSREGAYARPFLIPSPHLLESFESLVDPFGAESSALNTLGGKLAHLRDLLLPKLVTGQIDISTLDIDAVLEDAVA
ncbi:MAG: restriction endonuclease subunit S [Mycobacterium sp.]